MREGVGGEEIVEPGRRRGEVGAHLDVDKVVPVAQPHRLGDCHAFIHRVQLDRGLASIFLRERAHFRREAGHEMPVRVRFHIPKSHRLRSRPRVVRRETLRHEPPSRAIPREELPRRRAAATRGNHDPHAFVFKNRPPVVIGDADSPGSEAA